jgi:AraC family transcriptional regulator
VRRLAALGAALDRGAPTLEADELAYALAEHVVAGPMASEPRDRSRGLEACALARVVDHLHQHTAEPVSLDDLAALAHVSRFHFLRQFAASTGTTPYRYLARLRLQHAARLLARTSTPVEVVAARSGYGGSSQFTRAFRAEHGCSPSAYRRAIRRH